MALQADQLPMRGLQLDESTRQKLELDMREEVRSSILLFGFCVFGFVVVVLFDDVLFSLELEMLIYIT